MIKTNPGIFVGGHPALDFVNTVNDSGKSREKSRIGDWDHFQSWALASNIFIKKHQKQLGVISNSSNSSPILEKVHSLREATYSMLSSIASSDFSPKEDQAYLEAHIKKAMNNGVLNYRGNTYVWTIAVDDPDWLIGTLALSIESLIRSEDFRKLRECGRCSWLFLNEGRGKGRKWCDMRTCGNRLKSESFRNRQNR